MVIQLPNYLVHVRLGLGVACAQGVQLLCSAAEYPEHALFVGLLVEAAQLSDKLGQRVADRAEILGAHIFERHRGEICDVLLRAGAVLHDERGIGYIYLSGKFIDLLLLLRRKGDVFEHRRRRFGDGRGKGRCGSYGCCGCCGCGGDLVIERELGSIL